MSNEYGLPWLKAGAPIRFRTTLSDEAGADIDVSGWPLPECWVRCPAYNRILGRLEVEAVGNGHVFSASGAVTAEWPRELVEWEVRYSPPGEDVFIGPTVGLLVIGAVHNA